MYLISAFYSLELRILLISVFIKWKNLNNKKFLNLHSFNRKYKSGDFSYLCIKEISTMHTLDLILFIPIALGFVFGLFKGLIKELTSLAAIVLGIYGAKLFAPVISAFLIHEFKFSSKTALPVSYLLLFVAIALGLLLIANMLDKIFDSMSLGGLNKFLGGLFGALKYALIVSVLLNVFDSMDSRFKFIKPTTKQESIGYKPLLKFGPTLWEETKKSSKEEAKKHSSVEENNTNQQ